MPRRIRLQLWLALTATTTACIDVPEENRLSEPPPIIGPGKSANPTQVLPAGTSAPRASAPGETKPPAPTLATAAAADSSSPSQAISDIDQDAGPVIAGSGAAGSVGQAGALAAGSGGTGGMSGRSASGGQGGGGGTPPSAMCSDQLCITVVECWLLSPEECNYVACEDFLCR